MNGKQRMAAQSRQWLVDALIELMQREDVADISITEIVQTADLSRKTFYRAFKTKDDLIDYLCAQLTDGYFESLQKATAIRNRLVLKQPWQTSSTSGGSKKTLFAY